ncbi:MAG: hypothetical protein ACPHVU_05970, partial [Flavobacteriaceae bacterium]
SSSAAAASGNGATTSTSTRSGIDKVEETPNNNEFYPCLDNNCEPESAVDEFFQDYQDEDEALLQDLFGPSTEPPPTLSNENEPSDAVVINANRVGTTQPPVFKACTTLEECLGKPQQPTDAHTYLTPLDYEYYDYQDGDQIKPIRPPQEAAFATDLNRQSSLSRPQDSIVTRPVFSPDGTLLFEAEKTGTEEKLDRLIDSLGSLIGLLNATKEQGNTLKPPPTSIDQSSLLNIPPGFGAGQMGTLALPVQNDTQEQLEEESLFENTVAHHLGDHPLQGSAFFNIKTPFGTVQEGSKNGVQTTIPPHLIPLGPDGKPLLNPDGTPILKPGSPILSFGENKQKITDIFPFLSPEQQHLHQVMNRPGYTNVSDADTRDFITRFVNMARDLP